MVCLKLPIEHLVELIMKNRVRYQKRIGTVLSETFSSDVIGSILSSPTDIHQALSETDLIAKIKNSMQKAKKT